MSISSLSVPTSPAIGVQIAPMGTLVDRDMFCEAGSLEVVVWMNIGLHCIDKS